METEEIFQYSVVEVCREIVVLPTDSEKEMEVKTSRGFVVDADGSTISDTVATLNKSLMNRWAINARRPKHGLTQERVVTLMRGDVLHDFKTLLTIAASEDPIFKTLGIKDRPLRAALYCGAEGVITETKLGLAEQALELEFAILGADSSNLEEGPDRIVILERFQEKLIARL